MFLEELCSIQNKLFNSNPRFKNIGKDIWVYHDFLQKNEINLILNKINAAGKHIWRGEYPQNQHTRNLKEAEVIADRICSLLIPGLYLYEHAAITKLLVGQGHGAHSDNYEFLNVRNLSKLVKNENCFKWTENNVYGLIVYINDDYEGGEIFYTKQNITYKPKAGDLVIHSAEDHCEHGVNPVKTNIRYTFPSAIREKIKIPC